MSDPNLLRLHSNDQPVCSDSKESERLAALRQYDILDTPPEAALDDLTRLAAEICQTPVAVVSLLDAKRQWFKSKIGINLSETPREVSICNYLLEDTRLLLIEDALLDPRFSQHPLVLQTPSIRFYAGQPLVNPEGHVLGTFCVMDYKPRKLSASQEETLRILAHQVMIHLELRRNFIQLSRTLKEQKRIESALRDSETFYHSLVENMPQNILRKDLQGRFTFANKRFCSILGKSLEEILGKTDFDFFPKPLAEKYQHDDRRIIETKQILDTTEAHQAPGGEKLYVHVVKSPILDFKGEVIGIQGIFWDVSERRRIEEALAQERELLDTLLSNSLDRIYFKDTQSRFIKCSKPVACGLGISHPDQAIGKTDFDFFTEEHARQAFEDEQRIMRTGQPIIGLIEKETWRDGRETWGLTTKMPMRNKNGAIVGTFGITKDVTELKQVEAQLAYQRDLLQALMDNLPDCIYFKDRESRFLKVSRALSRRFNMDTEELIGKCDTDFFSTEHAREALEDEQTIIRTGQPIIGKIEKETYEDGRVTWALTTKMPLRDKDGKIIGTFGVSKDITDLKRVEAELEVARDAALESARLKSEFLANMSHEIRTPMNAIIGMTGLLLDTELTEEQRDFTETTRASADALLTVINDILDFSKIEAGKLSFEIIDFDLLEVVEGTVELLASRAQMKGIELVSWVHNDVPIHLRGDPGRLRQVLANLLSNAVKFTEHGEVVVRVGLEAELGDRVVVKFTVSDTGIGIEPQALTLMFQPFTQADGSMTRRFGGTGLGLAISKQLVEMMNGRIGVESVYGQGSTFWFTVNLQKQPVLQQMTMAEVDHGSLDGLHVLIVDDNDTNRQIVHHQILSWRMRNGHAASGQEALKILRQKVDEGDPYDLVILDQQMPEMDGLTLARIIHSTPALADTRMIMLTSLGNRMEAEVLQEAGISACLVKPVKQSRLYDCLAMVVGQNPVCRPRANEASEPNPGQRSTETGNPRTTRSLKILLAEDNPVNQKVALRQLQKLGYTADAVANGLEVLEALRNVPYDVILMDCQMPELDGYETTRRIRTLERSQGKSSAESPRYIIALTANALQGDREKCLGAGMNDYISKPVQMSALESALQKAASLLPSAPDSGPAASSQPVLDPTALANLRDLRLPDEEDPVLELIDLFIDDAPERLRLMEAAVQAGDATGLEAAAHCLKGSSSNLGAKALTSLCADMEKEARSKKLDNAPSLLGRIQAEYQQVVKALEVEKSNSTS